MDFQDRLQPPEDHFLGGDGQRRTSKDRSVYSSSHEIIENIIESSQNREQEVIEPMIQIHDSKNSLNYAKKSSEAISSSISLKKSQNSLLKKDPSKRSIVARRNSPSSDDGANSNPAPRDRSAKKLEKYKELVQNNNKKNNQIWIKE